MSRKRREANIYSVPQFSHYVPSGGGECGNEGLPYHDEPFNSREATELFTLKDARKPHGEMQKLPPPYLGRELCWQRFVQYSKKPYSISLWEQACLKYILGSMFEGGIDLMEFFSLAQNTLMMIVNCATVAINVFTDISSGSVLGWVAQMAGIVFWVEFFVVYLLLMFLLCVVGEAVVRNNIGTNLATDIAAVTEHISTFSALRIVSIVSPTYVMRKFLPMLQNTFGAMGYFKLAICLLLWFGACILAAAAVLLKMTQIDFTSTKHIMDWSLGEVVQLVGLSMNLARVDDSYVTETSVLLDAVHRHFYQPGTPKDRVRRRECLYTRVCNCLGIPLQKKYVYFDEIFDYHFENHRRHVDLTRSKKIRKMFNYLAFVFRMDNNGLRRFLQMTQSPLPFYQAGRDTFLLSFKERDLMGMHTALWLSDPNAPSTRSFGRKRKDQFNITFKCDAGRDIWDAGNLSRLDPDSEVEKRLRSAVSSASRLPT